MIVVRGDSFAITVLVFIFISSDDYEVEARPKDVIPVPGWFNSVEGFVLPNLKRYKTSDWRNLHAKHIINVSSDEINKFTKNRNTKYLHAITQKVAEEERKKLTLKKKKKKRRKRKKKYFIKSAVKDRDNNSAISKSIEVKKNKPVDIIVHIKMND